jgi:hypothetical protein
MGTIEFSMLLQAIFLTRKSLLDKELAQVKMQKKKTRKVIFQCLIQALFMPIYEPFRLYYPTQNA